MYCSFQYGGTTFPLRRESLTSVALDWAAAKAGLAGDLHTDPQSGNFFVGLDRLHQLLSQGRYEVHVSLWGGVSGAGAIYDGLHVGPENASYALTYDR